MTEEHLRALFALVKASNLNKKFSIQEDIIRIWREQNYHSVDVPVICSNTSDPGKHLD